MTHLLKDAMCYVDEEFVMARHEAAEETEEEDEAPLRAAPERARAEA